MLTLSPQPRQRPMSRQQRLVYAAIREYMREHNGLSPTYRELGQMLHVSHITAYGHVKRLAERGYIELFGRGTRNYAVVARNAPQNADWMFIDKGQIPHDGDLILGISTEKKYAICEYVAGETEGSGKFMSGKKEIQLTCWRLLPPLPDPDQRES